MSMSNQQSSSIVERLGQAESYLTKAGEIIYSLQVELAPPKTDKQQPKVAGQLMQKPQPVATNQEPIELKTNDEQATIGKIEFKTDGLIITPTIKISSSTAPFQTFLVEKVFEKMKQKNKGFDYSITKQADLIIQITVTGYNEEHVKELAASTRWCFQKMLEKQNENCPTPQHAPKNEPQKQSQTQPKTSSSTNSKTRSLDDVRLSFPEELEQKLSFEDKGDYITLKSKMFLGSDGFAKVAAAVRGMGGEYISAGKDSHFGVPKKMEAA
jgi:hypothetical protein